METNFFKRPVNIGFSIKSISLTGFSVSSLSSSYSMYNDYLDEGEEPTLIEPNSKKPKFIEMEFEQNPLNSVSNKRLTLTSEPLILTYHSTTINNIVYFFRSSETFQQRK